jgi:hypothetical protein
MRQAGGKIPAAGKELAMNYTHETLRTAIEQHWHEDMLRAHAGAWRAEHEELLRYRNGASKLQNHIDEAEARLFDSHGFVMDLREQLARAVRRLLPARYHPSLRPDGLYEMYLYSDDPAYGLAERYLEKHNFTALSAGYSFVGRPEDYARFEAALAALGPTGWVCVCGYATPNSLSLCSKCGANRPRYF